MKEEDDPVEATEGEEEAMAGEVEAAADSGEVEVVEEVMVAEEDTEVATAEEEAANETMSEIGAQSLLKRAKKLMLQWNLWGEEATESHVLTTSSYSFPTPTLGTKSRSE